MRRPHSVTLEAKACLAKQFRRQREVALRAGDMHVAEIGRQLRQKALHIGTVAVPGDEPVNGEAVPEVMQAWLMARGGSFVRDIGTDP